MQTFDFEKRPIIPQHCLWVSGLLLLSGCRADAGLPRLHRARHPAGNRLAMGEKVPGAWGAPGTDPMQEWTAKLESLWAGGNGKVVQTAQSNGGSVSLHAAGFLLWNAKALPGGGGSAFRAAVCLGEIEQAGLQVAGGFAGAVAAEEETMPGNSDGTPVLSGGVPAAIAGSAGQGEPCKQRVQFFPKPDPWKGAHADGGKILNAAKPASFCRKIITFNPTPKPGR